LDESEDDKGEPVMGWKVEREPLTGDVQWKVSECGLIDRERK